ncbi:MAG: molybdate ABC transporter permease subunit [Deltaproteobacteria bacterium]
MDYVIDLRPLWLTLRVASLATFFAFLAEVALAFMIARRQFWGRDWLEALSTLPLVLPPTVLGYYLLVLVGRQGWIGGWLQETLGLLQETLGLSLIFTWQGAVLAAAIVSVPLVLKSSRAAFEEVDQGLENVARTLGLSEWTVFLRVSFPLAWRGILAGTMLAFARAMGEFGATLMVAGNLPGKTQTLSLAVYDAVQAGGESLASLATLAGVNLQN